jgi:hypothetical protein
MSIGSCRTWKKSYGRGPLGGRTTSKTDGKQHVIANSERMSPLEFTTVTITAEVWISLRQSSCSYIDYGDAHNLHQSRCQRIASPTQYRLAVNVLYVLGVYDERRWWQRNWNCKLSLGCHDLLQWRMRLLLRGRIGCTIRKLTEWYHARNLRKKVEGYFLHKTNSFNKTSSNWKASIAGLHGWLLWLSRLVVSADFAWNTRGGGNALPKQTGFGNLVNWLEDGKAITMCVK